MLKIRYNQWTSCTTTIPVSKVAQLWAPVCYYWEQNECTVLWGSCQVGTHKKETEPLPGGADGVDRMSIQSRVGV